MTPPASDRQALVSALDTVAQQATTAIKRRKVALTFAGALRNALQLLWIYPAAYATAAIIRWLWGQTGSVELTVAALVTICPIAIYLVWKLFAALSFQVDRRVALSEVDRTLDLEDRLLTADQFLARNDQSAFITAAIEDARQSADRATGGAYVVPGSVAWPRRSWWFAVLAVLLSVFGSWMNSQSETLQPAPKGAPGVVQNIDIEPTKRKTSNGSSNAPENKAPKRKADRKKAAKPTVAKPREATPATTSETKEAAGDSGAGVSADATTTSGDSQSRGVPSDQSQVTDSGDKKPSTKKKRKKPKKPKAPQPTKKKAQPEKSGTTAGKGSAGGSSRNPTASTWSSKDKVVTSEEEPFDDDEEVDEEDSEQEARGGVQPTLRDRRPPVSRDLTIGFGNAKNPDANGRGGPGQQKKSRGVASLVLGVPVPDHVKGQPNPGKTKIHQERIEPQAENADPVASGDRAPRAMPIGFWPSMPLKPWMRQLVREYFSNTSTTRLDESQP